MEQQLSPFECAISEVMARFEEEMNAKNEAYLFIMESGNFGHYSEWVKQRHLDGRTAATAHAECVLTLSELATERPQQQV